ncbi:MAG: hypothetical protein IPI06_01480 [Gammaproteobacteria bacterium]|nr:hypothetical protein [Gammaproteobacteria bacterium]
MNNLVPAVTGLEGEGVALCDDAHSALGLLQMRAREKMDTLGHLVRMQERVEELRFGMDEQSPLAEAARARRTDDERPVSRARRGDC